MLSDARIPLLNAHAQLARYVLLHDSMETKQVVLDPYETFHPQSVGK